MKQDLDNICEELRLAFPSSETSIETFSSGAALLDVFYAHRHFILAYFPARGFGVEEVEEEDPGFDMHFSTIIETINDATTELFRLMSKNQQ